MVSMPTTKYEDKNKEFIAKAILDTYDIDPNKISMREQWGWNYILFEGTEHVARGVSPIEHPKEYEICHFTEDAQKIIIYLNKYAFENAGLGGISDESAKVIANEIKEMSGTNKDIYVYETSKGVYIDDIDNERLEGLNGYTEKLLYPEKKGILERMFRKQ